MNKISTKRRMPNTLRVFSVFLALALVAGLSFPDLVLAASVTVEAPSTGEVEVDAPSTFSNAEILYLSSSDGSETTAAVVAEGTLSFYAALSGTYNVERSGNDVWSLIDSLGTTSAFSHISQRSVLSPQIASTVTGGISGSSLSSYTGYEDSSSSTYAHGTQEMPIRALNHFVSTSDAPTGSVELSLVAANALLGSYYDSEGNLVEFEPTYLVVEDRDEDTGRLLASVTFSPDTEGSFVSETGGTDAFNLVVNPSEELLRDRLASHSSYASDTAALSALATSLVSFAESSSDAVVLAGLDSMAAYSTGAKEFTLDIVTLSEGTISAGDTVSLKYVAAGADENAHTLDAEQEALLAETYVQDLEVDEDGYITFTLLGGGIYLLGNDATVQSFTISESAVTSDGESESGLSGTADSSTSGLSGGATLLGSSSSASADSVASSSSSSASADAVPTASSSSSDSSEASDSDKTTITADSDLLSTLVEEEAAATEDGAAEGSSLGSSLSSLFTDESGNLNIVSIAVAVALVAACALAGIILYRRVKKRKEQKRQALAAAEAARAAEEERKAFEQMTPAERGQIATAAATTAAASAAKDGMSFFMKRASSEKIEETTEQKVKRKIRARTGNPSRSFVKEDSSVCDILNGMRAQGAAGQA